MTVPLFTVSAKETDILFYCSVIVIIAVLVILFVVFNIYYGEERCSLSNVMLLMDSSVPLSYEYL